MNKILFSDRYGLTQAVLNGKKTMTRRLEKALEHLVSEYEMRYEEPLRVVEQRWDESKNRLLIYAHTGIADTDREHVLTLNTRYKLNEAVAVAQPYKDVWQDHHTSEQCLADGNNSQFLRYEKGWNNKLFVKAAYMPNRIIITGVRIERLQDIADEECLKEGIIQQAHPFVKEAKDVYVYPNLEGYYTHPRGCFADLINRPGVGGKGLWGSNPFVVVYEFQVAR